MRREKCNFKKENEKLGDNVCVGLGKSNATSPDQTKSSLSRAMHPQLFIFALVGG